MMTDKMKDATMWLQCRTSAESLVGERWLAEGWGIPSSTDTARARFDIEVVRRTEELYGELEGKFLGPRGVSGRGW